MLSVYVVISMSIVISLILMVIIYDTLVTLNIVDGTRISTGLCGWHVLAFMLSFLPFINLVWLMVIIVHIRNMRKDTGKSNEKE